MPVRQTLIWSRTFSFWESKWDWTFQTLKEGAWEKKIWSSPCLETCVTDQHVLPSIENCCRPTSSQWVHPNPSTPSQFARWQAQDWPALSMAPKLGSTDQPPIIFPPNNSQRLDVEITDERKMEQRAILSQLCLASLAHPSNPPTDR